jgi:hypothetical protein
LDRLDDTREVVVIESLLGLLALAAGIAVKSLWDAWTDKKKSLELEAWKLKAAALEKRLASFYWPLYLRLQLDNAIWEKLVDRELVADDVRRTVGSEIEKTAILPNHQKTVAIIEGGIHLAALDPELEGALFRYLRHVAVYTALRSANITDRDPISVGEPYPTDFFPLVADRLNKYRREYDALLQEQGVGREPRR